MNYNEIAESLERESIHAQAKIEAAKAFRELGSLEGVKNALEASVTSAQEAYDVVNYNLQEAKAELVAAEAKAISIVAEAESKAEIVSLNAEHDADIFLVKAKSDAEQAALDIAAEHQTTIDDLAHQIILAQGALLAINKDITQAQADASAARVEKAAAEEGLASIRAEIDKYAVRK